MVLKPFNNDIIDELCSKDQLELLDSVDLLRSQGIDNYVSLPQIIVCGDQSSGKSSVLEAISGVSFPVKSNLCTRFPTELILRKAKKIDVSISIVPHPSHSESESLSLSAFHEKLDSFDALPELIEKAKAAMAISTFGRAFSKDLLRIELSGPERPHLTIVDLPGLIHSETKQQSASDIELVQDVVKSYMREPRSIILAVVSAKNDHANQIVLKLARAADKSGNRTLGVITKPDTLVPGSSSENVFVSLARNLDVEFRLGWHVLKNMDSETGARSLTERDIKEAEFLSQGIWNTLPGAVLGIRKLRERLSKVLLGQIATELPSLVNEIEVKLGVCISQLQKLGEPRTKLEEQQLYLFRLTELYQPLAKAAVDGTYSDPFFGNAKSAIGYQKRIRAVIHNHSQSFAQIIARKGHYYQITESPHDIENAEDSILITRTKYMHYIEQMIRRTRGRELPGTYNPMIVADLFAEQSHPWEAIAREHIEAVSKEVKIFLHSLIAYIADETTSELLFQTVVEPALDHLLENLEGKLTELLDEHQKGHPITFNDSLITTVHGMRKKRISEDFASIIKDFFQITTLKPTTYFENLDFNPLLTKLTEHSQPDMNRSACSEALDYMEAYYEVAIRFTRTVTVYVLTDYIEQVALKRFIDDVAVEAIEANMMSKLHDILSPTKVALMAPDVVATIAGESEESRARRVQLTTQRDTLRAGAETCKRIMTAGLLGMLRIYS